jgi:hypothetical protein
MSGFQLTASLASSLAWPVIVLILFAFMWIKRDDISRLFSLRTMQQGRTLRRLRAGPVELEWDQLIESTAEQVSEVPPITTSVSASVGLVRQELNDIARNVPTAAVLEAFARLEQRLREIFDQVRDDNEEGPSGKYTPRFYGMPQMVRVLSERGIIPDEIRAAILNLNRLRNEASHRVGGADITADQAYDYLELVDRILDYLKGISGLWLGTSY